MGRVVGQGLYQFRDPRPTLRAPFRRLQPKSKTTHKIKVHTATFPTAPPNSQRPAWLLILIFSKATIPPGTSSQPTGKLPVAITAMAPITETAIAPRNAQRTRPNGVRIMEYRSQSDRTRPRGTEIGEDCYRRKSPLPLRKFDSRHSVSTRRDDHLRSCHRKLP